MITYEQHLQALFPDGRWEGDVFVYQHGKLHATRGRASCQKEYYHDDERGRSQPPPLKKIE